MIQLIEEIGTGWLGPMWRGEHQGRPYRLMPLETSQYALRFDLAQRRACLDRLMKVSLFDDQRILNHLGVVPINGVHHWVAPWVDGHSLRDLMLANTQISSKRIGAVGVAISALLHELHQTELVHGCLMPEMLLLSNDGELLLDGSAIPVNQTTPALMGRNRYSAPELDMGPAGDVFSLGLILLEMALGKLPDVSSERIFSQINTSLRALQGDTPVALIALLQNMLHRDPKNRPSAISLNASFKSVCHNMDKDILIEWSNATTDLSNSLFSSPPASEDMDKTELYSRGETHLEAASMDVDLPPFQPAEISEEQDRSTVELAQDSLDLDYDYASDAAEQVHRDNLKEHAAESAAPVTENSKSVALDSLFKDETPTQKPSSTFFDYAPEEDEASVPQETVEVETTAGFRKPVLIGFGLAAAALSAWALFGTSSDTAVTPPEKMIDKVAADNAVKGQETQPVPSEKVLSSNDTKKLAAGKEDPSVEAISPETLATSDVVNAVEEPLGAALKERVEKRSVEKTTPRELRPVTKNKSQDMKSKPAQPVSIASKQKKQVKPKPTSQPKRQQALPQKKANSTVDLTWGTATAEEESRSIWGDPEPSTVKTIKAPPPKTVDSNKGGKSYGNVSVSGPAKITLIKNGKPYGPGKLAIGQYKVYAKFKGQPKVLVGYLRLKAGKSRRITCVEKTRTCSL